MSRMFRAAAAMLGGALCVLGQVAVDPTRVPIVREVFEKDADEKKLGCNVRPLRPVLTFAFQFQSGWSIEVPARNIRRDKHTVVVGARVVPERAGFAPLYLFQQFEVPETQPRRRDSFTFDGAFLLGPGSYSVEVALFDDENTACRKTWRIEAKLRGRDQEIFPNLDAYELRSLEPGVWSRFAAEDAGRPRSGALTVLLNAASYRRRASRIGGMEFGMMVSSLAAMLRFTRFETIRLTAYNLDQQRIVYQQDRFRPEHLRDLARELRELNLATVPVDVLENPKGHLELLDQLLDREQKRKPPSGTVLFFGPTTAIEGKWTERHDLPSRLLYFDFRPLWRLRQPELPDLVERLTKANGGRVFRIHTPSEFARALRELEL